MTFRTPPFFPVKIDDGMINPGTSSAMWDSRMDPPFSGFYEPHLSDVSGVHEMWQPLARSSDVTGLKMYKTEDTATSWGTANDVCCILFY